MADTDLPRDAAKILQQLADATRYSRKEYAVTADQIRILAKAFNQMQSAATSASQDVADAAKNINDAFQKPTETLVSFTNTGLSAGKDLQSLFAAIASTVLDAPVKKLNDELSKEQKILADIEKAHNEIIDQSKNDIGASEDAIKLLKDKITEEERLCGKKTKCNESMLASYKSELRNQQTLLKHKNDAVNKAKEQAKIDIDSQNNKIKSIQDQIVKFEEIKDIAKEIFYIFSDAFDRFVKLDKAAEDFRKSTRLMRDQMVEIEKAALNVNQELISQGVTIENAYDSAKALTESFSNSYTITQEQIKAVAQLNANLGVTESNAAGFLQRMESAGGLTSKQAIGMAGLAANAAKAAGVPLDKVMHDVANASDTTLSMMKGNVRQMTLAAIQAQRLGVSLEKAANSARGLLNFQESVDAEMEASVLLGRNLNLNYARQLSFAGDVAGAQKEILNQVRSIGDFTKMNVFQQEALAKATGYSVAELTSMLKNEEKLSKLRPEQRKAYEDATKSLKEQNEETGEQLLQQAQMQGAMSQLSNTFKSFKQILADILTPVVMVAVKLLIPTLKLALFIFNAILIPVKILSKALYAMWQPIEPLVQSVSDVFDYMNASVEKLVQDGVDLGVILLKISAPIRLMFYLFTGIGQAVTIVGDKIYKLGTLIRSAGGKFNAIFNAIGNVVTFIGKQINMIGKTGNILTPIFAATAKVFQFISNIAGSILVPIRGIVTAFGSAGGMVARFASGFGAVGRIVGLLGVAGKAIPIVGWIITGLQAVLGLFSRLMKGMNFFQALGETLYEVVVEPFVMLFDLLGKIPVIGEFFKMITTVFTTLKPVVTSVFSSIWTEVKSFFSNITENFKSMFTGGDGLISKLIGFMTFIPKLVIGAVMWYVTTVPKLLFGGILNAITTISTVIWDTLTGVFTKIKEWFSNFNLMGGLFGGITSVGGGLLSGLFSGITSAASGATSIFSSNTAEGKPEITTTPESSGNIINAIQETNRKLDMLITMMANGGIAVNLDGRKVSEQLAIASS